MYARHGTLSATPGQVTTVTPDADYDYIEVHNRNTTAGQNLSFNVRQAADPTSLGNDTYLVLANSRYVLSDTKDYSPAVVKLVSATASLAYSVTFHKAGVNPV